MGGKVMEVTVTSVYLPNDSDDPPPTKKLRDIVSYCTSRGKT
jgi:hypothetical protein